MATSAPTLRLERNLLRGGATRLACADEVGRGSLGGPVSVGMVVITLTTRTAPRGVRDSKLLTPAARAALVPKVQRWATAHAVGHASAAEIDAHGIVPALRLAGHRALAALADKGERPDMVLLDGNHDYLTPPAARRSAHEDPAYEEPALFAAEQVAVPDVLPPGLLAEVPPVVTAVKGDMRCAAVAAASILAKTERDTLMTELAVRHPGYGWETNKGYSAPDHIDALRSQGPCVEHRRSWSLPGVVVQPGEAAVRVAARPEPSSV